MKILSRKTIFIVSVVIIGIINLSTIECRQLKEYTSSQNTSFSRDGDVIFGGLFPVRHPSVLGHDCSLSNFYSLNALEYVEAMVYAIDKMNNRSDLLPGIQIGFEIFDTCGIDTVALIRALHFISREEANCNSSDNKVEAPLVGVVGATYSACSVQTSNLFRSFNITQISAASTSHILSSTTKYPNFFRTVQSDIYQAEMFIEMLDHFNWSYVSLVYSEGPYGTEAANQVRLLAEEHGICFALFHKVYDATMDEDTKAAAKELKKNHQARILIVFAEGQVATSLMINMIRYRLFHQYIILFSEAVNLENYLIYEQVIRDSFSVGIYAEHMPDFHEYFESLTINSTDNPWFKTMVEAHFKCDFNDENVTLRCSENLTAKDHPTYSRAQRSSLYFDATSALGHALHNLINNTCPEAFKNKSHLSDCVTGEKMILFMKNVSFEGRTGHVYFDKYGDVHGKYTFQQLQNNDGIVQLNQVGTWDRSSQHLEFSGNITFPALDANSSGPPESICSQPCEINEEYNYLENLCCWTCKPCRANEYLTDNRTNCKDCPPNHWPDEKNYLSCVQIEPYYVHATDNIGFLMLFLIGIGIAFTIIVCLVLLRYRQRRLVKASSKELSSFILLGIFLAYLTVIFHVVTPTDPACVCGFVLFHVSFTLMYGTLLLKTLRVYRVFAAGRQGLGLPKFVSNRSQLFLLSIILTIQVSSFILKGPI